MWILAGKDGSKVRSKEGIMPCDSVSDAGRVFSFGSGFGFCRLDFKQW